jgi:ATP-dependent helicase/nuclease subunit A
MTFAWAPAWLHTMLPVEPAIDAALTPSQGPAATPPSGAREKIHASARSAALLRGTLVHRLLQSLPDISGARRADAARQYLMRAGRELAAEHEALIRQVMTLLDDARFRPLFTAGSRAEVPIVGRLARAAGALVVSGQIDRLAVLSDSVLIADYKTDRPAPRRPEEVPRGYLRQLALYRAVLTRIYPDRPVRAALIWTDVPELMELSAEVLDAEIVKLTGP